MSARSIESLQACADLVDQTRTVRRMPLQEAERGAQGPRLVACHGGVRNIAPSDAAPRTGTGRASSPRLRRNFTQGGPIDQPSFVTLTASHCGPPRSNQMMLSTRANRVNTLCCGPVCTALATRTRTASFRSVLL